MSLHDLMRYALWGAVAWTADSNRRYYRLATTWLPHLAANTIALFLPDALRLIMGRRRPRGEIEQVLTDVVRDNDDYVVYVAPLAAGYLLSHPRFNIYKGKLAELRLAGFGLDSIPHALTALALTAMVRDSLRAANRAPASPTPLGALLKQAGRRSSLVSLCVLAAVTVLWELGEYRIHRHELALRGDVSRINMQWSLADTRKDVISNLIGWVLAVLLRP